MFAALNLKLYYLARVGIAWEQRCGQLKHSIILCYQNGKLILNLTHSCYMLSCSYLRLIELEGAQLWHNLIAKLRFGVSGLIFLLGFQLHR